MIIISQPLPGLTLVCIGCLQVKLLQEVVTNLMWAGIVPAAAVGAVIAYFRLKFFTEDLPERFRCVWAAGTAEAAGLPSSLCTWPIFAIIPSGHS